MTNQPSQSANTTHCDQNAGENARVGYQSALALWGHEGRFLWNKYQAMLLANSILLAGIVRLWSGGQCSASSLYISAILDVAGFVLCFFWYVMTNRSLKWLDYWLYSARELEEHWLDPVKTISRGGRLKRGMKVDIPLTNKTKELQIRPWYGLKVHFACYLVIGVFALIYLLIGGLMLIWLFLPVARCL